MSPPIEIVRLRITLDHVKPTVMRRIEVRVSIALDTLHEMIQAIMPWENYHMYTFYLRLTDDVRWGLPPSRERRAMIEEMQPLYRRFDLLVTANGSQAPRLDAHDPLAFWRRPNFTSPFNCTGGPALALPCGFSKDGLPLSLQIAGRPHEDALVLRAGHAYEMATGFFRRAPDLKPGAAPAALDPKPWPPDTSQVEPAVRAFAENAALRADLRLAPEHMEELVAVAPWALAMARRLRRDHLRSVEVSSIFDPTR